MHIQEPGHILLIAAFAHLDVPCTLQGHPFYFVLHSVIVVILYALPPLL